MTQQQQPQPGNPNIPPNGPEQNTADPFEFFTVDNIENLRDAQKQARAEEMRGIDPFNPQERKEAEARAAARYEDIRHDYLMSFNSLRHFENMDPADPGYADYESIKDHLGHVSIDQMNDDEWELGQTDAGGNQTSPSGRQMVQDIHDDELDAYRQELAARARAAAPPSPTTPPMPGPNNDPTQNLFTPDQLRNYTDKVDARHEAFAKLNDARDALAELTVKRQGKLADTSSPEYRIAHKAYNDALIAYGKAGEAMKDAANPNRTDDERKANVTEYLLHEAAELRRITNEKWDNKTVNKICKWMAKGNVAQRVLKGIAIGGGVTAATALVTVATAGTAGGAAIGGAAAAGAALMRGMRAYGAVRGQEMLRGNQDTTMTGTERDIRTTIDTMFSRDVYAEVGSATSLHNSLEKGAHVLHAGHEKAVQAEQKKNRRATYVSVGSIALGTTVATGLAMAADHVGGFSDKLHSMWHSLTGDKPEVGPVVEAPDNGGDTNNEGQGKGKGDGDTGGETASNNPAEHLTPNQYEAMATIDKGMGGIELFNELGLGASEWYQHEDALLKAHPDDFYRMADGHVGLQHPGKLSEDAMRDIAQRTGIWQTK